jgi:hypothetical protein
MMATMVYQLNTIYDEFQLWIMNSEISTFYLGLHLICKVYDLNNAPQSSRFHID